MRLRRARIAPPAAEDSPAALFAYWEAEALRAMPSLWIKLDADLKVTAASTLAREMFAPAHVPASLISYTRSAEIEKHGREVLAGERGPWEIEAGGGRRLLRLHGVPLESGGALMVLEDITEVRRLEAVRADFVANLAHELRTPVASLSLAAETLSGGVPPEEQQRFVARIAEETTYIEGLLRTVSELAFLEGSVRLQISEFSLYEVVLESWRRVVDLLGPCELEDQVPRDLGLRADRVRVAEILQNLFENAHRYTPQGRPVHVSAAAADGEVATLVTDEGPGIPPADLPRVFERFYKVDRARTRRGGDGSGLGLAICKHLVSAHGGRIWAEAGPSGGTRVTFTLPGIG